jgi:hypothetical protein
MSHLVYNNMKANPKMIHMKQNIQKRMFEVKEQNKKAKKTIPLKTEEDSNLRLLVTKSFSVKMLANFRKKRRNDEKLLQHKCSIYRGRGVVSRNASIRLLRFIRRMRVHSDIPRVTFFTRIIYSWNRIVGVNPLPEGLVLGNWEKTLHPQNIGSAKFVDKFVGHLQRRVFGFARRQHS